MMNQIEIVREMERERERVEGMFFLNERKEKNGEKKRKKLADRSGTAQDNEPHVIHI